jgi:hypothetical protein
MWINMYTFDLTIITYSKLEYAQSKQNIAYPGVVNRRWPNTGADPGGFVGLERIPFC